METTVFLIRHGVTDWHAQRRVLGQRDVPLNRQGLEQVRSAARALEGANIGEILSSPLQRAIEAAEIIGETCGIQVGRDPRLTDFLVGKWSGMSYDEVSASDEYQAFLRDPTAQRIPGGENLDDIRLRAVAAVEQALEDNPSGAAIGIVSHAGIIRVLLAHYLGSPPANYHRIQVNPGSISALSFADDRELPRILAVNYVGSVADAVERQAPRADQPS